MKKILILAALVMSSISVVADDNNYLTVSGNNIDQSITLATVQKITFEDGLCVVTTTEGQVTFPLADLQKMTFTADPTAIDQLAQESEGLKMQNGQLLVKGKGTLRIYNAAGALVGITPVEGQTTIGLQNLQRGLYIVNLGDQTIKIQR